ncbi:MAG: formylmethanofuran dehydrogenase subunit C [Methanospirillum sp.]|nr:formylmethanofuran dehydrogenase subunit C [Methanospirillum sp.]
METVTLTIKKAPTLYLEAEIISPDGLAGKTADQIRALPVHMGNEEFTLGEFFDLAGAPGATAEETKVVVTGDLSRVKYLGMKMSGGEMVIESDADMYVGAWMSGGTLTAKGNVDSFAGIGMKGGLLEINGNAGNYTGSAYRGDWRGMQGGKIHVKGNVRSDTGYFMNGGEIVIDGDADVHVGTHAEGGKIVIKGNAKSRLGGQMVEGTIILLGTVDVMMPGFKYVRDEEVDVDGKNMLMSLYVGDLGERHRKRKGEPIYGKLYIRKAAPAAAESREVRLARAREARKARFASPEETASA